MWKCSVCQSCMRKSCVCMCVWKSCLWKSGVWKSCTWKSCVWQSCVCVWERLCDKIVCVRKIVCDKLCVCVTKLCVCDKVVCVCDKVLVWKIVCDKVVCAVCVCVWQSCVCERKIVCDKLCVCVTKLCVCVTKFLCERWCVRKIVCDKLCVCERLCVRDKVVCVWQRLCVTKWRRRRRSGRRDTEPKTRTPQKDVANYGQLRFFLGISWSIFLRFTGVVCPVWCLPSHFLAIIMGCGGAYLLDIPLAAVDAWRQHNKWHGGCSLSAETLVVPLRMDCCRVIDLRLQLLLQQSMDLCRHTCIHMSQDLYHSITYLSIDRSIDLSVCLSIYLSTYLIDGCVDAATYLLILKNCVTACFWGRHDQCTRPVQAEIKNRWFLPCKFGILLLKVTVLQFLKHTQFHQTWLEIPSSLGKSCENLGVTMK